MNFIHIADVHLSAAPESGTVWGQGREKELYDTFLRVIDTCEEQKVDLLLIAGDLFHRQPLLRELKEVNYMFGKLTHTKVVMIAGNHDYIANRSNYIDFPWNENVTMIMTSEMDSVYFEELNTEVYGLSYHTRDIFEAKYENAFPGVEESINILLAHGGEETKIPINFDKLSKAGFDYVALGHFHKKRMISNAMRYCGSLEPLDKNETDKHGYVYGTIEKTEGKPAVVTTEFIPFACREYICVPLTVTKETTNTMLSEMLREFIKQNGSQNYYEVSLEGFRDPEVILEEEPLKKLGNVIEVVDHVLPDYDFDQLLQDNKENLIGSYISKIRSCSEDEVVTKKALYYGIEALLNAKER